MENMIILATLCYVKCDGKTLMVYRNRKPNDIHEGKWNGLGGKLEAGESPEECVRREVEEEAGLVIQNPCLHGLVMFPGFKGHDWYVFVFTATEFEGELIESPEGELDWIDDAKLTTLNLWPSDLLFLPWLEQEEFFSAKFIYEGEEFTRYEVVFY